MKIEVSLEQIKNKIYWIQGQKVMLDSDLAELYDVKTKVLLQAVKRNSERFPKDFMITLTNQEVTRLRSQIVTSKKARGGRRYLPYAFTEQGVAMLSTVLNSKRALQVNINIIRAFVKLREMLATNKELAKKINEMEKQYNHQFKAVFDALRQLMTPPNSSKKKIGFKTK